ncbi:DUF2970 domain-containing protein [Sporolituus thermophilus]|uniref:Uncharacterized protein n=1 Tax=Sporolituus thermophilus DSM 23256 TaxID=1123285 RepID=A0A1G7LE95_9FIRM|nr:DUF2970 domain-containing protein [Sporolituus thermophilus]SDF47775.1 Protein of unknown function [Sporolituus thermophilus DSM 23256]
MVKGTSKRAYHKNDVSNLNRTALIIGGVMAAAILFTMVVSFVM